MVRVALALALAGAFAVLSGGLLFLTAGSAGSASAADPPCVPSEAWTETTDWVLRSPGEGWRQVDERTVTDEPGWTEEVLVGWRHYSWTGGPLAAGVVPTVPTGPDDPDWQANTTHEPHANNPHVTWLDSTGWGLHYMSHEGSGLADWFHLERRTELVEHPALTHQEYRYAVDHPAVVCSTAPPTTQPPTTQPPATQPPEVLPTTATASTTPSAEPVEEPVEEPAEETTQQPTTQQPTTQQPTTQQPTTQHDDVEVLGVQASEPSAPSAQVPTAVDAGLPAAPSAGTTAAQQWGVVLAGIGMVLLASAGGVLVSTRQA